MANIENLRKNLESNGYTTSFFATKEEAADYICGALSGETVGIGGSMTVESMGIYDRLQENNTVYWHWKQDKATALAGAAAAEVYICSVNGVAETGELVNIDGTGNRLAASTYGKKKVFLVIGTNKVVPTLEDAISRARNIAAPMNTRRFQFTTPCAVGKEMKCYDCSHPQRICKGLQIFLRKMGGVAQCEVVIVDEALGF